MAATHVTHILPPPPSLLSLVLRRVLLSPVFPSSSSSSFYFFFSPVGGAPSTLRIIHILHPIPSRVRGKFLNFARIENFHILFPRRRGAARAASCSSQSSPSSFSSCDSCNRIEKFPKAMPFYPAFPRIVSRSETTSATRNLGFQRIKRHTRRKIDTRLREKLNLLKLTVYCIILFMGN